jgi:hypothetical protein
MFSNVIRIKLDDFWALLLPLQLLEALLFLLTVDREWLLLHGFPLPLGVYN